MAFEAEVIPLFIGGASIVCILELVFGCMILKQHKKARYFLIGHIVCMAAALIFLIRCIFAERLGINLGIPSISNSVNIGLFGVFWAFGTGLLLAAFNAIAERNGKDK